MKKTDTWLLRYSIPMQPNKVHDHRFFPTETTDVKAGTYPTLLKNREIIERKPDKKIGQEPMPVPLVQTWEGPHMEQGKSVTARFSCLYLEIPKSQFKKADFTPDQWAKYERDGSILKFAKRQLQTSWCDANGNQLNDNFYVTDQPHYILVNLDGKENDKAEADKKVKKLGYELTLIYENEDKTEFTNLCYLMGINPTGNDLSMLYNVLSEKIANDTENYEKVFTSPDRWYKVVINKALRTERAGYSENYINEKTEGQYVSYFSEGRHIATGMDALLGYYKDNKEMFEFLEVNLGLKKSVSKPEFSGAVQMKTVRETIQENPDLSQQEIGEITTAEHQATPTIPDNLQVALDQIQKRKPGRQPKQKAS